MLTVLCCRNIYLARITLHFIEAAAKSSHITIRSLVQFKSDWRMNNNPELSWFLFTTRLGWRLLLELRRYRPERREERGGWRVEEINIRRGTLPVVVWWSGGVVVGSYQCNERETMERLLRTGGYILRL